LTRVSAAPCPFFPLSSSGLLLSSVLPVTILFSPCKDFCSFSFPPPLGRVTHKFVVLRFLFKSFFLPGPGCILFLPFFFSSHLHGYIDLFFLRWYSSSILPEGLHFPFPNRLPSQLQIFIPLRKGLFFFLYFLLTGLPFLPFPSLLILLRTCLCV